jgi:hypothetical protein
MTIASKAKAIPSVKTPTQAVKAVKKIPSPVKTTLVKSPAIKKTAPKAKVIAKVVPKSLVTTPKIAVVAGVTSSSIKPIKAKKLKLVRDSFTIPKPEYLILDNLKLRATDLKYSVKKSELLRAGIKALAAMNDANFLTTLKAVPVLKSGRPSK